MQNKQLLHHLLSIYRKIVYSKASFRHRFKFWLTSILQTNLTTCESLQDIFLENPCALFALWNISGMNSCLTPSSFPLSLYWARTLDQVLICSTYLVFARSYCSFESDFIIFFNSFTSLWGLSTSCFFFFLTKSFEVVMYINWWKQLFSNRFLEYPHWAHLHYSCEKTTIERLFACLS